MKGQDDGYKCQGDENGGVELRVAVDEVDDEGDGGWTAAAVAMETAIRADLR